MMHCAYHAEVENEASCTRCGRALCAQCVRQVRGSVYCEPCLGDLVEARPAAGEPARSVPPGKAMVAGTSPGAAFFLGLLPGVGAIYNAEYFKAAAHLVIFGLLVTITDTAGGPLDALFALLTFGFYVYMPFEAYYTAKKRKLQQAGVLLETPFDSLHDQIASIENKDLWGGVAMVVLGGLLLLDNFNILEMGRILRLWPAVLIAVGVWLLKRYQDKAV